MSNESDNLDEMAKYEKLKDLRWQTGIKARRARYNIRRGLDNGVTTTCPSGHEYSPENTMINAGGRKTCLSCLNDRRVYKRPIVIAPTNLPDQPPFNTPGYQTRGTDTPV